MLLPLWQRKSSVDIMPDEQPEGMQSLRGAQMIFEKNKDRENLMKAYTDLTKRYETLRGEFEQVVSHNEQLRSVSCILKKNHQELLSKLRNSPCGKEQNLKEMKQHVALLCQENVKLKKEINRVNSIIWNNQKEFLCMKDALEVEKARNSILENENQSLKKVVKMQPGSENQAKAVGDLMNEMVWRKQENNKLKVELDFEKKRVKEMEGKDIRKTKRMNMLQKKLLQFQNTERDLNLEIEHWKNSFMEAKSKENTNKGNIHSEQEGSPNFDCKSPRNFLFAKTLS
jgi:chromosome segregation ATPase